MIRNYLYQNKRNDRKFMEVRRYSDGHYVWKQYVKSTNGEYKYYTGCTLKQDRRGGVWHRISIKWAVDVLADYILVAG